MAQLTATVKESIVANHHLTTTDNLEELFDLINVHDEVIGRITRREAHSNPALLHRSVQVLIFDSAGRVLLQRRSAHKDLFPGFYCASASGHVAAGDDYATTAHREMFEELGIVVDLTYIGKEIVTSLYESEMTALFSATSDGPFRFHPTETDGGDFFSWEAALSAMRSSSLPMTPALVAALRATTPPEPWGMHT